MCDWHLLYQDLIGGFTKRRQDQDGVKGDSSCLFCAVGLALYPAALLRELVVFDNYDELSFFEAQDRGIICVWGRRQFGHQLKENLKIKMSSGGI